MKYKENRTQEQRILDLLKERGGKGVFVYELQAPRPQGLGIAQYNARIWGLRRKGHVITNAEIGHFVLEKEGVIAEPKKKKEKISNKGRIISYRNSEGLLEQLVL